MLEIILPVDFVDDLSAQATAIVADLSPIWLLVSGLLLGLFVIAFSVEMFRNARSTSAGMNTSAMNPQDTMQNQGAAQEQEDDMDNEMP